MKPLVVAFLALFVTFPAAATTLTLEWSALGGADSYPFGSGAPDGC